MRGHNVSFRVFSALWSRTVRGCRKGSTCCPLFPPSSHFTENFSCRVFAFWASSTQPVCQAARQVCGDALFIYLFEDMNGRKVDSAVTLCGQSLTEMMCMCVFVCVFIGMCFGPADWSRAEQMGPHYQRVATEERIKPTVSAGYLLYHWLHHRLTSNEIRKLDDCSTFSE